MMETNYRDYLPPKFGSKTSKKSVHYIFKITISLIQACYLNSQSYRDKNWLKQTCVYMIMAKNSQKMETFWLKITLVLSYKHRDQNTSFLFSVFKATWKSLNAIDENIFPLCKLLFCPINGIFCIIEDFSFLRFHLIIFSLSVWIIGVSSCRGGEGITETLETREVDGTVKKMSRESINQSFTGANRDWSDR